MVWCETSEPNVADARRFAEAIHEKFPGKLLAYDCSPSFHWDGRLSHREIAAFQQELAGMGYRFQFVTLAGFHALNLSTFELACEYQRSGMAAYSRLQEREFDMSRKHGYSAVKHQRFVGMGYFDRVPTTIAAGQTPICALPGSTEEEQFEGCSELAPTLSEMRAVV
jgi:isocitrate lyase